jgi:hypothetical protein
MKRSGNRLLTHVGRLLEPNDFLGAVPVLRRAGGGGGNRCLRKGHIQQAYVRAATSPLQIAGKPVGKLDQSIEPLRRREPLRNGLSFRRRPPTAGFSKDVLQQ